MVKMGKQLQEMLAYQAEVKFLQAQKAKIVEAIDLQEETLQTANSFNDNLPELLRQKEDIQAALALGAKNQKDLAGINAEIEKAQNNKNAHKEKHTAPAEEAKAALAGLQRKLKEISKNLFIAQGRKEPVLEMFLRSEGERIGAEYLDYANNLMERFRQLLALANLHRAVCGHESELAAGSEFQFLSIPALKLQAHDAARANLGWLLEQSSLIANRYGEIVREDIEAERVRITALGVIL